MTGTYGRTGPTGKTGLSGETGIASTDTKTGTKGIELIKSFEGFSAKPYKCPALIPTIGYGATFYPSGKKVTMTDKLITEFEGE
jgi:GH24 family phage-related lysozyme (muramidase)